MLKDGIDGKFNDNKLPKCFIEQENENRNLLDYNKIKSLWNPKNVASIRDFYEKCFNIVADEYAKNADELLEIHLAAIDNILDINDNEFRKYVQYSNSG